MKRPRPFDERSFATLKKRRFRLTAPEPAEAELHKSVAQALDWGLMPPALYTTFPAGWGKLDGGTGGFLKGAGLKAGFPDILVFYDHRCVGIELKKRGKKLTPSQAEMHAKLGAVGVHCYICHSVDEVIVVLRSEGFPLRFAWKDHKGTPSWHRSSDDRLSGPA